MQIYENKKFDVIVVGSGPGGATVAKELSKIGKRVLILEKGTNQPITGTVSQTIGMAMVPGKSLLFTEQLLALVRGITAGGSSIFYYATAIDPPFEMLESYGVNIRNEVAEVKMELPIAVLKDSLIGPAAMKIMESAKDLGYKWEKLPKIVYQGNCRKACDKCTMGCPYHAKWTAREFIDLACSANATLVLKADVKKVLVEKNNAVGVLFSINGKEYHSFSDVTVLSAGGIGTPVILRSSGIKDAGQGFFFDPLIIVNGFIEDAAGGREFPMATGINFQEDGIMMTDLMWPSWVYWLFTMEVFRFDCLFPYKRRLSIMIKIRDQLGGRITGKGCVRKQLSAIDKNKLLNGYERARKILGNAGAKNIFKTWYTATHPGGTAKLGDIVDSNLQTKINHLYVCDCSVIPEPWGLPPTLTLLSLGKRLATHIAERW
ncbi:MAG: GMC family oxidoreductase N-terminal domain-containing protein [Deltaproteobacteria bacterium]|nr:GMC family oxidoreductase N-terminal domain-containing protein [Deltaproteobacteria bacterium]